MKNIPDLVALILIIVGGLNWGLVGLLNLDLVSSLFGPFSIASRIVYLLVGLAALYIALRSPRLIEVEEAKVSRSKATS